jgi:serine/threonine-protein kinase/endoribonuclease IRE1
VEFEDREPDASLLLALESYRTPATGVSPNWGAAVDPDLIVNLGKYRRYDYTSLRDLLRIVRNKKNHFREMPDTLQRAMGPVPEGYYRHVAGSVLHGLCWSPLPCYETMCCHLARVKPLAVHHPSRRYFSTRFPDLLMAVFVFAATYLADDPHLAKYWPDGTEALQPFCKRFQATRPSSSSKPGQRGGGGVAAGAGQTPRRAQESSRLSGRPPVPPSPPPQPQVVSGRGLSPMAQRPQSADPACGSGGITAAATSAVTLPPSGSYAAAVGPATPPAARPSGGLNLARDQQQLQQPGALSPLQVVVGYEVDGGSEPLHWPAFPQRPGQQACDFYMKTGTCKYATDCCFDHPEQYAVPLTELQLPYREGEPLCAFYLKTHNCKFGAACKFHHPRLRPIYAGSAVSPSTPMS